MNITGAKSLLHALFKYNLEQFEKGKSHKTFMVPMFEGDPGVGKTAIAAQVAEELGVPHHLTIIAQYDAGELGGFGIPTDVIFEGDDGSRHTEKRVIRARPDYLPDPNQPDGMVGIWNLDELPQAFLANQNICSQLVNAWRVGEHTISPGVTICCTGNKPENKAGTTPMPMHLRDRLMFIGIEPDFKEFNIYANQMGLHRWVTSFLHTNPSCLHDFQVGVKAFPSPRSWEKTSNALSLDVDRHIMREALYGQIGEGMATQFLAYCEVEDRIPDPHECCRTPDIVPVFDNKDADILYMLIANLVEIATPKNIEGMIRYVKRWPNKEFEAVWCRDLLDRHKDLNDNQHMTNFKLTEMTKILV